MTCPLLRGPKFRFKVERCYAVLACFLWQVYGSTIDHMIDMHDKLMQRVYNWAQEDIDLVLLAKSG